MVESKKVSVFLPTYQSIKTIDGTMRSVLEQSHADLTLFVFDDGSTDGTQAVLDRWAAADSRVKLKKATQNQGIGASILKFFKEVLHPYIAFIGHDDLWMPNHLESGLKALGENPEWSGCFSDFAIIDEKGEVLKNPPQLFDHAAISNRSRPQQLLSLLESNKLCAAAGIFRTLDMAQWVPRVKSNYLQDWNVWLVLCFVGEIGFDPVQSAQYRVHHSNLSRSRSCPGSAYRERRSILLDLLSERHDSYWLELLESEALLNEFVSLFCRLSRNEALDLGWTLLEWLERLKGQSQRLQVCMGGWHAALRWERGDLEWSVSEGARVTVLKQIHESGFKLASVWALAITKIEMPSTLAPIVYRIGPLLRMSVAELTQRNSVTRRICFYFNTSVYDSLRLAERVLEVVRCGRMTNISVAKIKGRFS